MQVGDKVTYRDINLYRHIGTIISIEHTPRGGDCYVQWQGNNSKSEECLANLKKV